MFASLVLATFIGLSASITVNDCPADVPRDKYLQAYGNSCFQFVLQKPLDHTEAEGECKKYGGTLVMLKTMAVQDLIFTLLTETYHKYEAVWIGLSYSKTEGEWVWSDGTALRNTNMNWHNGQSPKVPTALQDCAVIDTSDYGSWHDYHCEKDFEKAYICQYDVK